MRVGHWLTIAAIAGAIALAVWYMVGTPGSLVDVGAPTLVRRRARAGRAAAHPRRHDRVGRAQRLDAERLEAAARYVESALAASGYAVRREEYPSDTRVSEI